MVTRDKEKLIRKLLKEGKDWNYICKDARCSPNTIQKVQEKSEQIRAPKLKSKRSEALGMYVKGYHPLDVAIKLDISADEAENYKIQYWRLNHMNEFEQLYKAKKDSLPHIFSKLEELEARNISLDLLSQALSLLYEVPRLLNERQRLNNEIEALRADYGQRQAELWNIQNEILLKKNELNELDIEYRRMKRLVS